MCKHLILFFSFIFYSLISSAQPGKPQYEEIYKDSYIKVELQYNVPQNSCQQGSRPIRFQYKVTGRYRPTDYYLNWKMDYIDCNGNLYYQQNSLKIGMPNGADITNGIAIPGIDNTFTAQSIEHRFYEVTASAQEKTGSGLLALPLSKPPQGVDGPDEIFYGQKADLTVRGGALGIGAKWVWYEGGCGGRPLYSGETLHVSPTDATTYFVRAEGTNNTTPCIQKTVDVDKKSSAPTGVSGRVKICRGESTTLSVAGGYLGLGAEWVWYSNRCGGKKVGTGSTLTVKPDGTSTYWVRAESALNTTPCVSAEVSVFDKSADPASISISGPNTVCEGENVQLSVKGGNLSSDAEWKWYSSSCGSGLVASGTSASLRVLKNTTYYVRGEGECNNTNCASIAVYAKAKSLKPASISGPELVLSGQKTTLTLTGGRLSEGAEWQWFEGGCGSGKYVGSGTSINVRPRKKTKYSVRAVGKCEGSDCVDITVNTEKMHQFDNTYIERRKKFLLIETGLGAEWISAPVISQFRPDRTSIIDTATVGISAAGLLGEAGFYPLIKEWLSIGVLSAASIGTTTHIFTSKKRTLENGSTGKESYFYKKFDLGMELAFGFKPFKFLVNANESIQFNDYSMTVSGNYTNAGEYTYDQTRNRETIGFGIRFGQYADEDEDGNKGNFDLIYHLTKSSDQAGIRFDFDHLNQWNVGLGFNWWKHDMFKFKFDMFLPVSQHDLRLNDIDSGHIAYQLSLIFTGNWFY